MRAIQHGNLYGHEVPPRQYRVDDHGRSYTLVLDMPEYSYFRNLIQRSDIQSIFYEEIQVGIGISMVNPVDQFSRKEGLKIATSNVVGATAKIAGVSILSSGDIRVKLFVHECNASIDVILGASSNRPRIASWHFYEVIDIYRQLY